MENESLTRRLKAINALMSFSYGSLWVVGENIWKEKLVAKGYDLNSNRREHPGVCIQGSFGTEQLHVAIPMLYGTSGRMNPAYTITNFYNDPKDKRHVTYFGAYFGAVPIEITKIGTRKDKNVVRRNMERPQLSESEVSELRRFTRRYLSIA